LRIQQLAVVAVIALAAFGIYALFLRSDASEEPRLSQASTSTATSTPRATSIPLASATPAPTAVPDRADCSQIRDTDYQSESERQWFIANCVSSGSAGTTAQRSAAGGSSGPGSSPGSFSPLSPLPPLPTATPVPPYHLSAAPLIPALSSDLARLQTLVNAPRPTDPSWQQTAIGTRDSLLSTSAAIRGLSPSSCFQVVHQYLLEAVSGASSAIALVNQGIGDGRSETVAQATPHVVLANLRVQQASILFPEARSCAGV
jgi:hypothetical protein